MTQTSTKASAPPPNGIYVPAVLFFDENEELDEEAIKSHVIRLAQVSAHSICTCTSTHSACRR